jgi:hypothetical protein
LISANYEPGAMVEEPLGGIILIGGSNFEGSANSSRILLRLPYAGASWLELPLKLQISRWESPGLPIVAIPFSKDLMNCTVGKVRLD